MFVKAGGGGLKALVDMSAKNSIFFWKAPFNPVGVLVDSEKINNCFYTHINRFSRFKTYVSDKKQA